MKLKKENQFISQVVVLSMIFGLASGIVGQILADVYFDPWKQDYINQDLFAGANGSILIPELRRVERFLGIEQDFEVNKSINKISPGVVGVYQKKPAASTSSFNRLYLPPDLKANGFVITSDGWIISHGGIFSAAGIDQLVVIYDGKVFDVVKTIADSTTGVIFIKINAGNLPIVAFGDSAEINLGQLSIILNDFDQAVVASVKSVSHQDISSASSLIMSSEEYDRLILLSGDGGTGGYLGSPLVNLGGEVIGIINKADDNQVTAIPINQFRTIISDVLRSDIIKRPFLGVTYLDISKAPGLGGDLTQGLSRGALVYQNPLAGSPAGIIGIKKDDIILSVDGRQVEKSHSLTDLVQQYKPGDQINLEIMRLGQTLNLRAALSVLAN